MTPQLGKDLLYLSEGEVSSLGISMREIIEVLERAFREKAEGHVEMPPKIGIHSQRDSFLHAMPALIPSTRAAGMKWVGGYPANQRRGLPYISGLLMLNDYETGIPIAVMDCTWITAERTAAATAVAAKYLARPDSSVAGMLACGVQARAHLRALQAVLPVRKVRAYDVDPARAAEFAQFARSLGLEAEVVSEPRRAVAGCDVVVTSGPILRKPHATVQRGWLEPGAFASLVDFDSYWHPAALHEADKFCTDDVPQLNHYREIGYFQDIPPVYAELADLVTGRKPGRQSRDERTIACNLGLALEDLAVAPLVYERARQKGTGTWLPL